MMSTVQNDEIDTYWMTQALSMATRAAGLDEVPVGAILVSADNEKVGEGWNQPISSSDPTAHAEIMALRQAAGHVDNYRLPDTTLYVTLEPCPMCAGAIVHARIGRLVIATPDPRSGSAGSVYNLVNSTHLNHRVDVTFGVLQNECSTLLKAFFQEKRRLKER